MHITMQIIADSLSESNHQPQSHLPEDMSMDLVGARLFPSSGTPCDIGHVYVASSENLDPAALANCVNLIVADAGHDDTLFTRLKSEHRNSIVVQDTPDAVSLLNQVSDIFSFYNARMSELLHAVASDVPLAKCLNIASRLFGNPIFILDTALTLVTYTRQAEGGVGLNEETWSSIVQKKHVTLDTVNYYASSREPAHNAQNREPFFHSVNPHIYNSIRLNIFVDDLRVGRMAIVDDCKPLKQGHLAIARQIAPLITNAMRKEMAAKNFEKTGLKQFICRQLDGFEYTDLDIIERHIAARNWKIAENYYLIKVINESEAPIDAFAYTMREAKTIFGNDCALVMYRGTAVFIVNVHEKRELPDQCVERMMVIGEMHALKIGVSMLFDRFNAFREHHALVSRAIEVGSLVAPSTKIYHYDAFAFMMLLHEFSRNSDAIHIETLCCEEARVLHEHDRKNDTNLLESLSTYLIMERSLKKASEKLHIHRNSLVYRIEKATDIVKIDFDDAAARVKIIMSSEILRYSDRKQTTPKPI